MWRSSSGVMWCSSTPNCLSLVEGCGTRVQTAAPCRNHGTMHRGRWEVPLGHRGRGCHAGRQERRHPMRGVNLAVLGHSSVHGLKVILRRNACGHTPHRHRLPRRVSVEIILDSSLSVVMVGAPHPGSATASHAFTRTLLLVSLSSMLTLRVGLRWGPVTDTMHTVVTTLGPCNTHHAHHRNNAGAL